MQLRDPLDIFGALIDKLRRAIEKSRRAANRILPPCPLRLA